MAIPSTADVVIVGSGFGGSISAARFAEAGKSVVVLELGEEWNATKFQQSQDMKYIYRIFRDYPQDYLQQEIETGDPIPLVVTQGMGLGGGSLIYSNVHLRAPESVFTTWPAGWTRADLDPFYARVETRLSVQTYPTLPPRGNVFVQACQAIGRSWEPVPVALVGCRNCGWCTMGCKFDKKQSMLVTYIPRAKTAGAQFFTNYKVMSIAKSSGRYNVRYISTAGATQNYHIVTSGTSGTISAGIVVLAGGAVESPVLLMRSLSGLNSFSTTYLGKNLSGDGDFAAGGMVPQTTDTYKGKIISVMSWDTNFILQDLHGIPAGPSVKFACSFPSINNKMWDLDYKRRWQDYGTNMLGIAIMGDSGAGITVTNNNGVARVSGSFDPPAGSMEAANSMITALGGEIANTPYTLKGQRFTVHPQGGCAMGQIVDPYNCQLMNNPNIYVIDGSVLPGGTIVNPSHTISAVAERVLDRITGTNG